MRKTKIVCTLGLASNTSEVIEGMIDAGMDVARFNFSHGTHESHSEMLQILKEVRERKNRPVAALLDTKGPEIRLGTFSDGPVILEEGDLFRLYMQPHEGDKDGVSVTFGDLWRDVNPGDTILIDDGLIELKVRSTDAGCVTCEVVNGGPVSNRKGVNIPGITLSMPYLSEQDRADILFGIEQDFDFVAASFVRSAADVMEIRELLAENGGSDIRIIAKIENGDGVRNIYEILQASDGIMVARGDMGVEIPFEELPSIQKQLIEKAYLSGRMVITATQMLESMVHNPRPTRAEATDVANAVYDGTSAIMLSGETAAGDYPVKAVETMALIAERTEGDINYRKRFDTTINPQVKGSVTNAISHATCTTAYDLEAAAIVAVSISGRTARNISKFRPSIPIVCATSSERTWRQLALSWGVQPIRVPLAENLDELFTRVVRGAEETGLVKSGDLVVITTGVPLGVAGSTNLIKVHIAGDVLVMGTGVNSLKYSGKLCVARDEKQALQNFRDNDILVIGKTTNNLLPLLKRAGGIVTEEDGLQSHAAVVGLALDIPVIVGAQNATNLLMDTTIVTLDAQRGVVCNTASSTNP